MVTSRDVAQFAGVSQPTVSRALRGDARVSEATRQRVRDAAAKLGYTTNPIGRALSVGRSTRVGLVVTDLDNQFYGHVISPLHDELQTMGYELVLVTESSETGPVADHVAANGLCGVVLTTTTVDSVLPVRLQDRGVPFVYFNRTANGVLADAVTVDPVTGMTEMVDALVEHGHQRVGAVFGPQNTSTGQEREETLRALLEEKGIAIPRRLTRHGPFDFATGYTSCRELMEADGAPSVIVCGNDVVAVGALNAAVDLHLDVPGDVSIVGFDDLPTSRWPLIQLSTVAYDLAGMSRAAARMVVARVENDADRPAEVEAFPTRYVARRTLGPAPR